MNKKTNWNFGKRPSNKIINKVMGLERKSKIKITKVVEGKEVFFRKKVNGNIVDYVLFKKTGRSWTLKYFDLFGDHEIESDKNFLGVGNVMNILKKAGLTLNGTKLKG